jgi:hypothetical protein
MSNKKKFKDLSPKQQENCRSLKRQAKKLAKLQLLKLEARERATSRMIKKFNPAFECVEKKYDINSGIYRKLSSIIQNHAIAAANEFAELIDEKSNEKLVHFFFDYFLCYYVMVKPEHFHPDNHDAHSSLIDGLHIEYYGNASNEVITSTIQLFASQSNCFFCTVFALFKNTEPSERVRLILAIACYCAGQKTIGATEIIKWNGPFNFIQNSKLSSIDTLFNVNR